MRKSIAVFILALMLSWKDNSNNEEAFVVELRIGGQGQIWREEAIVPANQTQYSPQIYSTRRHCWRVRSYNAAGESNPTNVFCYQPKGGNL